MKMYGGSEKTHLEDGRMVCGCGCATTCNFNPTMFTRAYTSDHNKHIS